MVPGVCALRFETTAAESTSDCCNATFTNAGDFWACRSDRKKLARNSVSGAGAWPVRRSNYPFQAVLRSAKIKSSSKLITRTQNFPLHRPHKPIDVDLKRVAHCGDNGVHLACLDI